MLFWDHKATVEDVGQHIDRAEGMFFQLFMFIHDNIEDECFGEHCQKFKGYMKALYDQIETTKDVFNEYKDGLEKK